MLGFHEVCIHYICAYSLDIFLGGNLVSLLNNLLCVVDVQLFVRHEIISMRGNNWSGIQLLRVVLAFDKINWICLCTIDWYIDWFILVVVDEWLFVNIYSAWNEAQTFPHIIINCEIIIVVIDELCVLIVFGQFVTIFGDVEWAFIVFNYARHLQCSVVESEVWILQHIEEVLCGALDWITRYWNAIETKW